MGLFDFFKNKKATQKVGFNNTSKLQQKVALELWEHSEGIPISWQHVSGSGIHIICETRYFPQNRSIVVCENSSANTTPTYVQIFIPENIGTAEELIDYVKHHGGGHCFVSGYKLSKELEDKLNCIL